MQLADNACIVNFMPDRWSPFLYNYDVKREVDKAMAKEGKESNVKSKWLGFL